MSKATQDYLRRVTNWLSARVPPVPTKLQDQLLLGIGIIAVVWYFYCIFRIGIWPAPPALTQAGLIKTGPPQSGFYQFMSLTIATVSGTLATFLGMTLGFRQANDATGPSDKPAAPATNLSWFQAIAAWSYVLSLVLALALWGCRADAADPIIESLGKSFLGLIGGVLIVALNVNNPAPITPPPPPPPPPPLKIP